MTWIEVSVSVRPADAERAGDLLLRYCPQGFSETPARHRRVLRVYLPLSPGSRPLLTRLRRHVTRTITPVTVRTGRVEDTGWVRAWRAHARPMRIGRLLVLPTWMRPAERASGLTLMRLDPGMAFGSGEHASTQLCLAAIERYVRRGTTVIDVGTGSGILAVAAARLGAPRVLAIDTDPVAVAVAGHNVRTNRVADRVYVRSGVGLVRVRRRADLIVANLTADTLPAIFDGVRRCLAARGRFVGSGFGGARVKDVMRAMAGAGLRPVQVDRLRGWRAVHAVTAVPERPAKR